MRLPDTLKPWRAWLGWFDPELVSVLGELMLRLHPLLGAFRMRALRGAVEPEGIDDLRRRGSYERLLLSEWALADVVPEEFDRRAAAGEHLFLSPKLVAREVDALTVAVFDTGPSQLGAPRLVHVAMWILLAQRAQAAKARFAWGVLGKPGELFEADNANALKQLLNERSFTPGGEAAWQRAAQAGLAPPREEHEREWQQWLDAAQPSPGERWSIGSHAHGYGLGHRVDVQRASENELAIVIAARQARRETRLNLPDPKLSSRLLRGQFDSVVREESVLSGVGRLSLKQPPLISFDGHSVAVPLVGENAANVYRLPSATMRSKSPPKITRWAKEKTLLAATLIGRHFGGVIAHPDKLEFWQLAPMRGAELPPAEEFDPTAGRARLLPCFVLRETLNDRPHARVLLLSGQGRLLTWTQNKFTARGAEYQSFAGRTLAIANAGNDHVLHMRQLGNDLHCELLGAQTGRILEKIALPAEARAGFLCGRWLGTGWHGGCCVEQPVGGHGGERSSIWRVFLRSQHRAKSADHEIVLPADWKVVGLRMNAADELDLIALRPDRRAVVSIGAQGRATLYESPYQISVASVATDCDVIALVDLHGRLVVLRDRAKSVLVYAGGGDD
jgi:hypothetical protein